MAFSICRRLGFGILLLPLLAGGQVLGKEISAAEQAAREEAVRHLEKVLQWAQQAKPSEKELMQRLFAPVVQGNEKDAERNRQMAVQFMKLGTESRENRNESAAKKYLAVATLFKQCSEENKKFLAAFKAGDMMGIKGALQRLKAYDDQIEKLTGKRVNRGWYVSEATINSIQFAAAGTPQQPAAGGARRSQ